MSTVDNGGSYINENFPAIDRALEILRSRHSLRKFDPEKDDEGHISVDSIDYKENVDSKLNGHLNMCPRQIGVIHAPYISLRPIISPTIIRRLYVPTHREVIESKREALMILLEKLERWNRLQQLRHYWRRWCKIQDDLLTDRKESLWDEIKITEIDYGNFSIYSFLTFIMGDYNNRVSNQRHNRGRKEDLIQHVIGRYGKDKLAEWFSRCSVKFRVFYRLKSYYLKQRRR